MAVEYGKFQLLKKIASGGMGQVFLARTSGAFDKLVVLKRILPQLVEDEEFIEMFFDEARIAARLNHPNLVQIFELSEAEGSHYLAMEYVAGEDLRRADKKARLANVPFPIPLVLRVIADAAAGLDYAHKARDSQGKPLNLIHRDVSPQNILVGFDGAVKLIDFGVAKAAGRAQHTASGILKGKYPYMSPEQADGQDMDGRSDLFALGIVAWEMLTGRRLFKGDSDLQTLRLVKECQVPPPSRFNEAVPRALDEIILKSLAREPAGRQKDAGELRLDLENFLISHAMPGSSAHLAAFMQNLYKERIEEEADPSQLDQLSPSASIEPGATTPSPKQSATFPRWDVVPEPSEQRTASNRPPAPSEDGVAVQIPAPRKTETQAIPIRAPTSRGKIIAGIGGAVLLVAVGVALPFLLGGKADDAVVPPPKDVVTEVKNPVGGDKPVVDEKPLNTPPEEILVELLSTPSGADVLVGGKKLGATPLKLPVPADGSRVLANIMLDGYESAEEMVSKTNAPSVTVELKKKRAVVKSGNGTKKVPPPLGIKTGR